MRRHLWIGFLSAAAVFAVAIGPASANILEDFQFNDAAGTEIQNTNNDAGTGHMWDSDADLSTSATNGAGQYDLSAKNNNDFGSVYVDADDIAGGQIYGVMELTWDFETATLDPAENEEIRLSLIQFDPRSTFVTGEFEIQREDNGEVTIFGNAVGTGAVDTATATLTPTQSNTFIAVIAANLDTDDMAVHYSDDGGGSFNTLGGGVLDPSRGFGSLRAVFNNDLSQDSVLIDRIYLTDMNPFPGQIPDIPEPGTAMLLAVGAVAALQRRRA